MMTWHLRRSDTFNEDLCHLARMSPQQAARWIMLVSELDGDQRALDAMLVEGHSDYERDVEFGPVYVLSNRQAANIWRIKANADGINAALRAHRLLYAPDDRVEIRADNTLSRPIWLLGLMPRREDYRADNPAVRRILAQYEKLGIRLLPRV